MVPDSQGCEAGLGQLVGWVVGSECRPPEGAWLAVGKG